jgi:hypothetical protein
MTVSEIVSCVVNYSPARLSVNGVGVDPEFLSTMLIAVHSGATAPAKAEQDTRPIKQCARQLARLFAQTTRQDLSGEQPPFRLVLEEVRFGSPTFILRSN